MITRASFISRLLSRQIHELGVQELVRTALEPAAAHLPPNRAQLQARFLDDRLQLLTRVVPLDVPARHAAPAPVWCRFEDFDRGLGDVARSEVAACVSAPAEEAV